MGSIQIVASVALSALFLIDSKSVSVVGAFTLATLSTSISFHTFSVANTVFSCGVSRNDSEVFEKGKDMTKNAKGMLVASVFTAGGAFSWLLSTSVSDTVWWWFGGGGMILLILGSTVFLYVSYHQGKHSEWYEEITVPE